MSQAMQDLATRLALRHLQGVTQRVWDTLTKAPSIATTSAVSRALVGRRAVIDGHVGTITEAEILPQQPDSNSVQVQVTMQPDPTYRVTISADRLAPVK